MGDSWVIVVYLLLGLGVVGALYYAVTQITARQRRLDAEMTRLERLAAEVAMNAEAILERVDERIDQLEKLSAALEARAAQAQPTPPEGAQTAPPEGAQARPKRIRSRQSGGQPAPDAATGSTAESPASPVPDSGPSAPRRPRRGADAGPASAAQAGPDPHAHAGPAPHAPANSASGSQPSSHSQPNSHSDSHSQLNSHSDSQLKLSYPEIRTRVYAMADAGHDALDIAQALGIPRGEVQLILNLRGAKTNA